MRGSSTGREQASRQDSVELHCERIREFAKFAMLIASDSTRRFKMKRRRTQLPQ